MDDIRAGCDDGFHFLTQTGEVGGQDAGRDAVGHDDIRIRFRGILPVLAVQ
jgi:hypothetical protein